MFLAMLVEGPAITATAALGASLGHFNVLFVLVLSFFANFLPDVLYYALGRWGGQWALEKFGPRVGIPRERRERAAAFVSGNVGRWLWFIKTVPFISPPGLAIMGALNISVRRFIWWDVLIVAVTSLMFTLLGYYSGQGFGFLQRAVGYGPLWLGGIFLLFLAVAYLYNNAAQRFTRRMRQDTDDCPGGNCSGNEA